MNPNISYRQGMHELAAIIFLVVENDSVNNIHQQEFEILLDSRYIEADTFMLFFSLMRCTKAWYESMPSSRSPQGTPSLPILKICEKVMFEYLKPLDYQLFSHLTKLEIEPQLFGLYFVLTSRWFRLLFAREFPIDDVFCLWDGILAFDSNMSLVEWIAVAMLKDTRKECKEI